MSQKLTESDKIKMNKAKEKIKKDKVVTDFMEIIGLNPNKRDGWINALTGLGGNMDKSKYTEFGSFTILSEAELSYMYAGDGLGRKIVDTPANDMTREWVKLEHDKDGKVKKKMNKLSAQLKINEALKWSRLFGGSLVIIGALDGQEPYQPLKMESIKSVSWLYVIDITDIEIERSIYNSDMRSPDFGKIEQYYVRVRKKSKSEKEQDTGPAGDPTKANNAGDTYSAATYNYIYIHRSRVLEFFGDPMPRYTADTQEDLRYWGASVLQSFWEQLRDLGGVMGHTANILYELVQTVYKFKDLSQMLAEGNEQQLLTRMQIINMYKSVINSVFIGEDEEVFQLTSNISGIAEIIEKFMIMLSAVANIPVTRLFGRSPAGMNATGESDEGMYFDSIKADQTTKLKPQIQKLVEMIAMSKEIKAKEIPEIEFNPLFQLTEKEEAEMENKEADTALKEAQTAQAYLDMGAIDSNEIRNKIAEQWQEDMEDD